MEHLFHGFPTPSPGVYAREGKEALMRCLYLEEGYFRRFLEQTGLEERI